MLALKTNLPEDIIQRVLDAMDMFDKRKFRRHAGRQYTRNERTLRRNNKLSSSLPAFEDPDHKELYDYLKNYKLKRTKSNRKNVVPFEFRPRHSRKPSDFQKSIVINHEFNPSEFGKSYLGENSSLPNNRKSVGGMFSELDNNSSVGNLSRNDRTTSKTEKLSRFFEKRNREKIRKTSDDRLSRKNGLRVKKSNSKKKSKYNTDNKVLKPKTKNLGTRKLKNSPMPQRNGTSSYSGRLSNSPASKKPVKIKMIKRKPVERKNISYLDNKKPKKVGNSPKVAKSKKSKKMKKGENNEKIGKIVKNGKNSKSNVNVIAKKRKKSLANKNRSFPKLTINRKNVAPLTLDMADSVSLLSIEKSPDKISKQDSKVNAKIKDVVTSNGISIPLKVQQNRKSFNRRTNALRKSSRNLAAVTADIMLGTTDMSKSLGNLQIHKRFADGLYTKRKENLQMNGNAIDEKIELGKGKPKDLISRLTVTSFHRVIQKSKTKSVNAKSKFYGKSKFEIFTNLKEKNVLNIDDDIYFGHNGNGDGFMLSPKAGLLNAPSSRIGFSTKQIRKEGKSDSVRKRRVRKKVILASSQKVGVFDLTEYEPSSQNQKRMLDTSNQDINTINFMMESYDNYIRN